MIRLFLCNAWQILVTGAYMALIPAAPDAAHALRFPMAALTFVVFVYNAWDRRRCDC